MSSLISCQCVHRDSVRQLGELIRVCTRCGDQFPASGFLLSVRLAVSRVYCIRYLRRSSMTNTCVLFALMVKAMKAGLSKKCVCVWVAGGDWCSALSYSCGTVARSLQSQDLCICHLATNLLPGYNTLFLISIASNRTGVERLVSLDRGGAAWCQHSERLSTNIAPANQFLSGWVCVCVCVLCRGLALFWQTDTTSLWASAFWDLSTIIELCHGRTAHQWHVTNNAQRLFSLSVL